MNYTEILEKQKKYIAQKDFMPGMTVDSFDKAFEIEYTHNSTAIEGNTLTLIETKVVLEDGISIGGKSLREIYEVINHKKAFDYVKECVKEGLSLNEEVVISGASHVPPVANDMYVQIKSFFADLPEKKDMNFIQLAAWTHAEFVRIHPFQDGNGRTARLIMNYQLMRGGFLPISIAKEDRLEYYNTLDSYASKGELEAFVQLIAKLEETQLDRYLSLVQSQE